ncbi:MAG TPA: 3-keto-5-aminohexanoate cleavage protein [Alphaproteobacteria bacterium]|jgi:uncharacterized protein (DUF849 family)|nr:3-keto-5-aminohexanoate cleavage protein [Alphaproteobacteria bacterium]
MAGQCWLEVALNGPWGKRRQPHVPVSVDEIVNDAVACVEAGAAIVHFHAYDVATGRQKDDADLYAAIVDGVRSRCDAIVYPTLPADGSADIDPQGGADARFAALKGLADRGLVEWGALDPGSMNFAHAGQVAAGDKGFVYTNSVEHIRAGLGFAATLGLPMAYAIYEPGFLRLGAQLAAEQPGAGQPIYRLMFTDGFTFSYPPKPYALQAYHELLREFAPDAPWMIAGLDVDLTPLIPLAVALGGHVRVGLEDARLGTPKTNLEIVTDAVSAIEGAGGSLARPDQIRASLRQ